MSKQIMKHTQQAYILSLNIITEDNNGLRFAVLPIIQLTTLVMFFWSFQQAVNRHWYNLAMLLDDISTSCLNFCEAFYLLVNVTSWLIYKGVSL